MMHVQDDKLPKVGRLFRRDRTFLTWKIREFVLDRGRLQYYNVKGTRKGDIAISETTPITIRLMETPRPFSFILFIHNEKLTLAASTDQERQSWVNVFHSIFHANIEIVDAIIGEKETKKPTFVRVPNIKHAQNDEGSDAYDSGAEHNVEIESCNDRRSSLEINYDGTHHHRFNEMKYGNREVQQSEDNKDYYLMTLGPMKEAFSGITFPPKLGNQEVLVGVGPLVRRLGWSDERLLAVGFYIDAENAWDAFKQHDLSQLIHSTNSGKEKTGAVVYTAKQAQRTIRRLIIHGDQSFYDQFILHSAFGRTFVISARKRVSRSVLVAFLHDELQFRAGISGQEALETFLSSIEKSLKKADSMIIRLHPDGRLEYISRGKWSPPIASIPLCTALQGMFFDANSIHYDAKKRLVERIPSLWSALGMQGVSDKSAESKGSSYDAELVKDIRSTVEEDHHACEEKSDYEDKDDDESIEDDEDVDQEESEDHESAKHNNKRHDVQEALRSKDSSGDDLEIVDAQNRRRQATILELFDAEDISQNATTLPQKLQSQLSVLFGPMLDPDSLLQYSGRLSNVDDSVLLGTWATKADSVNISVGLYVDPVDASGCLLKFKGQSVGSVIEHPEFFNRFGRGEFAKHFVFRADQTILLSQLIEFLAMLQQRMICNRNSSESVIPHTISISDPVLQTFIDTFQPFQYLRLCCAEQFVITIDRQIQMKARILRNSKCDLMSHSPEDRHDFPITHALSATLFQSTFYGQLAVDPVARFRLVQRLPILLDIVKDDLVHTYHDEIQVLRENYKRQRPENRVKVGYLMLSYEKRKKMVPTSDGQKRSKAIVSRWAKRWCRLDGTCFSYYSNKRSKRARGIIDISFCQVSEIKGADSEFSVFFMDKSTNHFELRIGILQRDGKLMALKTECVYDGAEWLDTLIEAVQIRSTMLENNVSVEHVEQRSIESCTEFTKETLANPQGVKDVANVESRDAVSGMNRKLICKTELWTVKENSLWLWLIEDSRNRLILIALFVIVWLCDR